MKWTVFVRRPLGLLALAAMLALLCGERASAQNEVWGWGDNLWGNLTNSVPIQHYNSSPTQLLALPDVIATSVGTGEQAGLSQFMLALKSDGTIWACGDNRYGQLGNATNNGNDNANATPTMISGLSDIVSISAGGWFAMALKSDGTVWTWGYNGEGELGNATNNGNATPNPNPSKVSGLPAITAISAGENYALALDANGNVWAWGENYSGQLGNSTNIGSFNANPVPAKVLGLTSVKAIFAAGGYYSTNWNWNSGVSLAIDNNGNVWAWGDNYYGQMGNSINIGTHNANYTPAFINGLEGITVISASLSHCLAGNSAGVWAWGHNSYGELGNGTTNDSATPVSVSGLAGCAALAAGGDTSNSGPTIVFGFSAAVMTDGSVWTWGEDYTGQLGNGTQNGYATTPTRVSGITGAVAVSVGGTEALVLTHQNNLFFVNASTSQLGYWREQFILVPNSSPPLVAPYPIGGNFLNANAPPAPWRLAGTGDFLGNGMPDLIWQNQSTGQVAVWYMSYSGGTANALGGAYPASGVASSWQLIGTADFNSDGYPDLLWRNTTTGNVAVWFMALINGMPTATGGATIVTGVPSKDTLVGAIDLNHDGVPDLILRDTTTGDVLWWQLARNNGSLSVAGGGYIEKAVSLTQSLVAVLDLDGDGYPDLLWQNASTGQLSWRKMLYRIGAPTPVGSAINITSLPASWKLSAGF